MLVLVFLSLRSALFVSLCLSRGSMCVGGNGGGLITNYFR